MFFVFCVVNGCDELVLDILLKFIVGGDEVGIFENFFIGIGLFLKVLLFEILFFVVILLFLFELFDGVLFGLLLDLYFVKFEL